MTAHYKISKMQRDSIKAMANKELRDELVKWNDVLYESPYRDALQAEFLLRLNHIRKI